MNRERAEAYLRLLVEAELRGCTMQPHAPTAPTGPTGPTGSKGPTGFTGPRSFHPAPEWLPARVARVAWALAAVHALDVETAECILADIELALAARRPEHSGPGGTSASGMAWVSGPVSYRVGPRRFPGLSPLGRISRAVPGLAGLGALPRGGSAPATGSRAEGRGTVGRYVPVGLMILFHDQTISGELNVMSYAHTASGARLVAVWQARDPLGSRHQGLPPVDRFEVTDDRGTRYDLEFDTMGRPESTCDLSLRPDPPDDIRWLDITAPGEAAVRVNLDPAGPPVYPKPEVSEIGLSAGEHLLHRIAERLLAMAPDYPQDLRLQLAPTSPGPLTDLAASLGDVVAALEAAEVLSPLSPVPGRLAALCASLRVSGHGLTAAPALDLPEPWLSLLAHYHRRRPEGASPRDGFAALAADLPELDGLGLVLLGLHNTDGRTWMNALALGQLPDSQHGPLDRDMSFPLSVWIRDSTGRWHVARPTGWSETDGEHVFTLRLVPALTRPVAWIEVLAAGRSAEVRAKLPLRWGYPP